MRSKALADLDALFARIDQDPDLCDPCKAELLADDPNAPYDPSCTCPPYPQS